ncbi:hypothetical protein DFH29DRAFT_1004264 [Suillus ampliporus]|nr:hypothetical protein DFH29DRAFT_1004264 [Suillus ampliporus]
MKMNPFDLSFPPIDGIRPSLTLKVTFAQACQHDDSALLDLSSARLLGAQMQVTHKLQIHEEQERCLTNGSVNYFQWVVTVSGRPS